MPAALTTTAHAITQAVLLYAFNVPPIDQIKQLFPDGEGQWAKELAMLIPHRFGDFWFRLDSVSQRRYISLAMGSKYSDQGFSHADKAMVNHNMERKDEDE